MEGFGVCPCYRVKVEAFATEWVVGEIGCFLGSMKLIRFLLL